MEKVMVVTHNRAKKLRLISCIVLVGLSFLVCFAHSRNVDPTHLELSDVDEEDDQPCWKRPSGCDIEDVSRFETDCIGLRLATSSNHITCMPYSYLSSILSPLSSKALTPESELQYEQSLRQLELHKRREQEDMEQISSSKLGEFQKFLKSMNEINNNWSDLKDSNTNQYRATSGTSGADMAETLQGEFLGGKCYEFGDDPNHAKLVNCMERPSQRDFQPNGAGRRRSDQVKPDTKVEVRSLRMLKDGITQRISADELKRIIEIQQQNHMASNMGAKQPGKAIGRLPIILVKLSDIKKWPKRAQIHQARARDLAIRAQQNANHTNEFYVNTQHGDNNLISVGAENSMRELNTGSNVSQTLECRMSRYTFTAHNADYEGNRCWGHVSVNICFGRCETGEISDWLFPHTKSIHKVCTHGVRVRRRASLSNCSSDTVAPSLREYHYVDALSCNCQRCNPADTTCGSLSGSRPSAIE